MVGGLHGSEGQDEREEGQGWAWEGGHGGATWLDGDFTSALLPLLYRSPPAPADVALSLSCPLNSLAALLQLHSSLRNGYETIIESS